jgi:glycosyltransferase involved in cell wall biosynthesis
MLVNKKCVGTVSPLLGLPTVQSEFAWAFAMLVDFSNQYVCGPDQFIHWNRAAHAFHDVARNQLAAAAVGEWHLQLDADHAPGPDLLFRLLNAMRRFDADVVTGLYLHRSEPCNPTLWKLHEDGGNSAVVAFPKGEVLEVDCAGAGCLLVKTDVYRRIREELGEEPFSRAEFQRGGGVTGEDFAFFRRLKKLGIKAVCPTYVECPHLQTRPLWMWKDYDPDKLGVATREVPMKARKVEAA